MQLHLIFGLFLESHMHINLYFDSMHLEVFFSFSVDLYA